MTDTGLATRPTGNGAIAPAKAPKDFKELLEKSRGSIEAVIPKHLTADRLIKIALIAYSRTPALQECSPMSILQCVMTAAQLGLDVGGVTGGAYLVPFKNAKTGQRESQFIIGYRGMIDLARRSGQIVSLEARAVYQNDRFECEFGLNPKLLHVPAFDQSPGDFRLVYAVAQLRDGGVQCDVMTKSAVDAIKSRSKASSYGPWVTDYVEMAKKTVIRRLFKMLPVSIEMAGAMHHENEQEPIDPVGDKAKSNSLDAILSIPANEVPALEGPQDPPAETETESPEGFINPEDVATFAAFEKTFLEIAPIDPDVDPADAFAKVGVNYPVRDEKPKARAKRAEIIAAIKAHKFDWTSGKVEA